ncbi:MAG TPA: PDDEXK nuclease domain-containing protein [Candidatus Rifleibacterium sp.]|nr:PDDEXK nuclease domain-containing protein [Candidatus Rifleibacterium sp.]
MKKDIPTQKRSDSLQAVDSAFIEVVSLIQAARQRAYQAVNAELVNLYWQVGEYISRKLASAEWGDGVVDELAHYLARTQPGLKGFTRRNLFRMRQFYDIYNGNEIVTPLVTQLPWTHHLIILGQSKRHEEREFYLRMAIQERWSKRELERQFKAALFERVVMNPTKVSPLMRQIHPAAVDIFKDSYVVEFLQLPAEHDEADLHCGLVNRLKEFLIELGHDFCFVGSEYPLQVGGRDFALDRDHRKPHENPAIGLLLCATKDEEVVEYALSRSLSPALIAEYQTQLPEKKLLAAKLHEFYSLNAPENQKPEKPKRTRGKL